MGNVLKIGKVAWWAVPLLAASLACSLPGQGGGRAATPAASGTGGAPLPPINNAPPAVVATSGPGDPVDLCKLATPDEVQTLLGGPATKAVYDEVNQHCDLTADNGKMMLLQAGHGEDGKTLHLKGMESVRGKITDPAMVQLLDRIAAEKDTLSFHDLVEQGLPVWQSAGYEAESVDGLADGGTWYWVEEIKFAEMGAWRLNDKWVALYLIGYDKDTARSMMTPLVVSLLDRLPDNFTPTGTGW